MKRLLLIPILLASVAGFGQGVGQYCCSAPKVQTYVTELTQCEKDELQKANKELATLKERILVAHGKPASLAISFHSCGDPYYVNTFGLYDDAFVIETEEKFTMTCTYPDSGSFVINYQTTNN